MSSHIEKKVGSASKQAKKHAHDISDDSFGGTKKKKMIKKEPPEDILDEQLTPKKTGKTTAKKHTVSPTQEKVNFDMEVSSASESSSDSDSEDESKESKESSAATSKVNLETKQQDTSDDSSSDDSSSDDKDTSDGSSDDSSDDTSSSTGNKNCSTDEESSSEDETAPSKSHAASVSTIRPEESDTSSSVDDTTSGSFLTSKTNVPVVKSKPYKSSTESSEEESSDDEAVDNNALNSMDQSQSSRGENSNEIDVPQSTGSSSQLHPATSGNSETREYGGIPSPTTRWEPGQDNKIEQSSIEEEEYIGMSEPQPLSYKVPAGYTETSFGIKSGTLIRENIGRNEELWLIKVPYNFEKKCLHKATGIIGGNVAVCNDSSTQAQDREPFGLEIAATRDNNIKNSSLSMLLPSKKYKKLHYAGHFKGTLNVRKTVLLEPYKVPEDNTKRGLPVPDGLKQRFQPFGAGGPLPIPSGAAQQNSDSPKKRKHSVSVEKKKQKKKKQKVKDACSLETSTLDESIDSETHEKKKKRKKVKTKK